MSHLPAVFTIERVSAPTFRDEAGREPRRFLGHDNDGRLVWAGSLRIANTYPSKADAKSFRRHRLGMNPDARIVRHTIH